MKRQNVFMQGAQISNYRSNVVSAVQAYAEFSYMTISKLAISFRVSENTITEWLCEAISNHYIASDAICFQIMRKHIAEYEFKHNIHNSCLREKYQKAFATRSQGAVTINVNGMLQVV